MTKMKELMDHVRKKGYGTVPYDNVNGDSVYISRGIRAEFMEGDDDMQKVIDAIGRFQKGDYGDAAEHGKSPREGHEYGRYEITHLSGDDSSEDPAVWIHRADNSLIVYFRFER